MAINIGALTATLDLDQKDFDKGLDDAEKRFKQTNERLEKLSGGLTKVGASLVALSAPFLALGKAGLEGTQEMEDFKNATAELSKEIGNSLKPALTQLTKVVQDITSWYSNLSEGTKSFITYATLTIATVGTLLVVFGQLLGVLKGVREAMLALNAINAFGNIAKQATSLVSTLGPLAVVVGTIVLVHQKLKKATDDANAALEGSKKIVEDLTTKYEEYNLAQAQTGIITLKKANAILLEQNANMQQAITLFDSLSKSEQNQDQSRKKLIEGYRRDVANNIVAINNNVDAAKLLVDILYSGGEAYRRLSKEQSQSTATTNANTQSVQQNSFAFQEYSRTYEDFLNELGNAGTPLEDAQESFGEYGRSIRETFQSLPDNQQTFSNFMGILSDETVVKSMVMSEAFQRLAFAIRDSMTQAGQSFVDFLDRIGGIQELTLAKTKEFVKELAIMMISSLEKQVIAEQVAQIARTWARNIGTFGVLGVPKAAGESALILGQTTAAVVALEALKMGVRGLAEGGIATGPSLAVVGEGKYNEAVLPLSQKTFSQLATGIVNRIGAGQSQSIVNNNNVNRNINLQLDGRTIASYTEDYLLKQARNRGSSLYTPRGGN